MGQVLSTLGRVQLDWRYIAQGFVNGLSLYVALPLVLAALSRRRLDPSTWRTGAAAGARVGSSSTCVLLLSLLSHQRGPAQAPLLEAFGLCAS